MKYFLLPFTFILLISHQLHAQVTIEYLDINNIKAGILTHGDMFWNPASATASYEFPKGNNTHSNFASSIWIAGYDTANNLHVSAQTYRQGGNDYWPGPLDSTGVLTATISDSWDKIWKINQTTIDSFINLTTHTLLNTAAVILEWPAKGNIYAKGKGGISLSINKTMAPFVDVNSDGIYNALDGDYPKIKGEQALWWVFSDNGPSHDETNGIPFKIEVQAMAYACNSIPSIQNTTFYNYSITNYNSSAYLNTRIGLWNDFDLGYAFDDFVGCDTIRRMGISYNGDSNDDAQYGTQLTQTGTVILRSPLDNGPFKQPLGSFMYYDNIQNVPVGNPDSALHYGNYLNNLWIDGQHLTNACDGRTGGTNVSYIFPDDPSNSSGWSEKQCLNTPGDRRFIMSTSNFTFPPLDPITLLFAVVNTPIGSVNNNFNTLKALADSALVYTGGCSSPSVTGTSNNTLFEEQISIYPNPANDKIIIQWSDAVQSEISSVSIVTLLGEKYSSYQCRKTNKIEFTIQELPPGIYFIQIQTHHQLISKRFIKN